MTDMTAAVQRPTSGNPVTPTYTQCTAADKFYAGAGARYMLHYKNGATPTTGLFVNEQVAAAPPGTTPSVPSGATKWSDMQVSAALGATTERVVIIDNVSAYRDVNGFVNLQHGTPTTLTLAIFGPL